MADPNVQQGAPEPSKKDILNGLFDQALKAMKDSVSARRQIDPSKDLVALDDKAKESFEAPKSAFYKKFDLGEYEIKPDDLKDVKIEDKHAYLLVGSVDQVAFDKAKKREAKEVERGGAKIKWYQALQQDAELFLQVKDRVETDFPGLTDTAKKAKMMDVLDKMSKMTDFTDAAWAKMIADNKYTDEEIYGAEGAYNLLLAFQRAIGSVDRKALLNPPKITLEAIPPYEPVSVKQFARISLELSGKKGTNDEDRFSRLIGVEVKEAKKDAVAEAPKTDPDYTYTLSDDQKKLTVSRTVKGRKESKDYPIDNKDGLQIQIHRLDLDHSNKLVAVFQGNEVVKFEFDPKNGKFMVFGASPNNQYDVELNANGTIVIKKKEAPKVDPQEVLDRVAAAGKMIPYKNFEEAKKDGDIIDPDGDGKFEPKDGYELVAPDMKTNFAVKEKAQAVTPPSAPAEDPKLKQLKTMTDALNANGFEVKVPPSDFNDQFGGYVKYGDKRIHVWFQEDGTYTYSMLNLPQGRPDIKGSNVDVATMKAALDAEKYADKLTAMRLDLEHVVIKNPDPQTDPAVATVGLFPLTGKDPTIPENPKDPSANDYEPNTYRVVVSGYRYENTKNGKISPSANYEFETTIVERLGYKGTTQGGSGLKLNEDPEAFVKEALARAWMEDQALKQSTP